MKSSKTRTFFAAATLLTLAATITAPAAFSYADGVRPLSSDYYREFAHR